MKLIGLVLIILALMFNSASCSFKSCEFDRQFNYAKRPSDTQGWKEFVSNGVKVKGDFVLNLGESTDNGKFGVKVLEITPAICHFMSESELPKARIQIYRVTDQKVMCEGYFSPGFGRLDTSHMCGENFEWSGIGVNAINAKEGWVAFRLGSP